MSKRSSLLILICLWSICVQAQTPTEKDEPITFSKNTSNQKVYNENAMNQLSFLLNTQQYNWSPTTRYPIRSKKVGCRLQMAISYPDSVVSYKLIIPQLVDFSKKKDNLFGVAGYTFELEMKDSLLVECSAITTRYGKTKNLSFFAIGEATPERVANVLYTIKTSSNNRWLGQKKLKK